MKRILLFLLVMLSGFGIGQAQVSREQEDLDYYFPKHHFDPSDRGADRAGEVASYMRLADLEPWWQDPDEAFTLIRITMLPQQSHPIFVEVAIYNDSTCFLYFNLGSAICEYFGEEKPKGKLFNETFEHRLTAAERDSLKRLLKEVNLPRHPHYNNCWGFKPPYVIEYLSGKTYNAVFDECYEEPLGTLVDYIVSLVDPTYADMYIYYPEDGDGIVAAQFPGGDSACQAFIDANLRYPERALADLEEDRVSLHFIVERDGSMLLEERESDDYGFRTEAERIFHLMPRWLPAMDNGRPVRSHAYLGVRFQLPDSLQPVYGTPRLETYRDSNRWNNIYTQYRRLLPKPNNQTELARLGEFYYSEFLLPLKPQKEPNEFDSIIVTDRRGWESFFDRTPVVDGAADSALRYYYRALVATDSVTDRKRIDMYLPIRQMEQYLGLPHNPLNRLPYDTVPGIHYPYSYFINLPADGTLDTTADYLFDFENGISTSYFWVDIMSNSLDAMSEPVLYDSTVAPGDTICRFAFYPSFHPPLCFRVEQKAGRTTLYWTKLDYSAIIIDSVNLIFDFELHPRHGERKLGKRQYRKLMRLLNGMDFDHLPRIQYMPMVDGADWCIERRTADGFKANFTNLAGGKHDALYSYLIRLSRLKADYASRYCH